MDERKELWDELQELKNKFSTLVDDVSVSVQNEIQITQDEWLEVVKKATVDFHRLEELCNEYRSISKSVCKYLKVRII